MNVERPEATKGKKTMWGIKALRSLLPLLLLLAMFSVLSMGCGPRIGQITDKDRMASMNFYQLAVNDFSNGNIIAALRSLEEAEKYNPKNEHVKYLYGLIFLSKKMHALSEEYFKAAIRLEPKFSDAYIGLASVHMDQGHWQEAVKELEYPSQDIMYPRKDVVFDNMAWCYFKLGDSAKAVELLKSATTENVQNCHAWYNLGRIYKANAEYEAAIDALSMAVSQCDTFFFGYYELALAAIQARDNERARPALQKCLELGGVTDEAKECKKYLQLLD